MKQTLQIKQHEVEDLQSQLARAGEEADRTRLRLEAEVTSLRDEVKRVTTMLESEKEKSASLDARVRQVEALLENERAERYVCEIVCCSLACLYLIKLNEDSVMTCVCVCVCVSQNAVCIDRTVSRNWKTLRRIYKAWKRGMRH